MNTLTGAINKLINRLFDFLFDHADEMDNEMRIKLNQMWRKQKEMEDAE